MIPIVIADKGEIETYKPAERFDLTIHLTNQTGEVNKANCTVMVLNSSYGVILNESMVSKGRGWYNYTYNQSNVGKYFCSQSCVNGGLFAAETCDFIIGVEDNMLLGMIVFIPLFIAAFLLVISFFLPAEKFWALKIALPILGLVFIFQSYQYGVIAIGELYAFPNLINAIGDNTRIFGIVIWTLTSVVMISFIYDLFMLFSKKKGKHATGDYEEHD